jgi:APA family basic amino acid/polyamine antiporter
MNRPPHVPSHAPSHVPSGNASTDGLRRIIGPVTATSVVIGAIIGVGIFFTPTSVAKIAGSAPLAMWTWVAGGVVALLGALTFAELGGMYRHTAGQYQMLRDSYGPLVAFCFSLCNACAIITGGTAIISIVCAENLSTALTGAPLTGVAAVWLPAVLLASVTAANIVGVRWGAAIQNATVIAKVAALLLVTALALIASPHHAPAVASVDGGSPMVRLFSALVPAVFAFGGGHYALWVAGEMKNPRRDVPLSLVLGVSIVIVVYLLANWAYLHLLGYQGVVDSHALAADAVSVVWPSAGRRLIAGAVALSAFGVLNVQILSGPRLLYGMARDGRFFAPFGRPHPRFATPAIAIALVGGMATALVAAAGKNAIDRLLTGVVIVDAVFFALTGIAVMVLRRRRPDADRPVRVPLYPIVPLMFVALQVAIIFGAFTIEATRSAAWIGLCTIAIAVIMYVTRFRHIPDTAG